MAYELSGQVALITGSTGGIGKSIADAFAAAGATVWINGSDPLRVQATVEEINAGGGKAVACPFDVADRSAVFREVNTAKEKTGPATILVNNAGISPKKNGKISKILEMDFEEWQKVIDVNLNGVFNCCQSVLPDMVDAGSGKIITISSAFGRYYSNLASAHYMTTKAAVIAFTHALCGEMASMGIQCNAVAPGRAWTDLTRKAPMTVNEAFAATIPMKRFAEIEEITNVVMFLASEKSSYINGATIDVNGGVFMS